MGMRSVISRRRTSEYSLVSEQVFRRLNKPVGQGKAACNICSRWTWGSG